jgi:O-antigen biosynthesis protein WbqP
MKLRMEAGVDKLMPGLTGWAQINGRDEISLKDKVKLEKYYMDNQSLYLDIKILFLTFNSAFLKSKNISH